MKAGEVEKRLPVTVKSSNLLAYGPASANGLTATVTDDGGLHVTGQTSVAHKGIEWNIPAETVAEMRGRFCVFNSARMPSGMYAYVHLTGVAGADLGNITSGVSMLVPETVKYVKLRVVPNTTNHVEGDTRIQLNFGDAAVEWMRPDTTDLEGGGV